MGLANGNVIFSSQSRMIAGITTCVLRMLLLPMKAEALIPASPREQTTRAIASIRQAVQDINTSNSDKPVRLFVDYLIPLPPETDDADIDPWPGGLAQMYPYAETIVCDILEGVVQGGPLDNKRASSQVLSPQDCCGLFIQPSQEAASKDVAAIVFPGPDQLDKIAEIDDMVGDTRTLLIFNRQFQRPADFGIIGNSKKESRCNQVVFDRFEWGFAFQEFACRSEDVKLTFEYPNWQSCAICSEDADSAPKEIALLDPTRERPQYEALEKKINEVLPEPIWMRKMGEAEEKGLKFQRK